MAGHPELHAEQAYIDHAHEALDASRKRILALRRLVGPGGGGTHQSQVEREVVEDTIRARLSQLEVGDASLVFGRIDPAGSEERFYIGRVAVADASQEPVVVDWRAPVAEPFYRATGRRAMGLARRRHFATRGRHLLGIEDEHFGLLDGTGEASGDHVGAAPSDGVRGRRTLLSALERPRSGHLGDIVATIQGEQDEIIRADLGGVVVVQGGPGTGKTVVALHRAAYLLYTHRFPLEGQGVVVIGPNRLYLSYIERVLPSLGEAGVELAVLADLVPEPVAPDRGHPLAARVKGDVRMVEVLRRAVADRQRPLRRDLVVGVGLQSLRCDVATSRRLVETARRRSRHHNAGRRLVERGLWSALAASARRPVDPGEVQASLRRSDEVRAALEWMWPRLSPTELLVDLFGAPALLHSAAGGRLSAPERAALERPRPAPGEAPAPWTDADVALLDEARTLLGPRRRGEVAPRAYGHLVVDEAQDLTPMELRMLARRSLGGSMTVVGDIAQATGALAPEHWDDVLAHLPQRRPPRRFQLSVAYRTPAAVLALAERVLPVAAPGLDPPRAVREGGDPPVIVAVPGGDPARALPAVVEAERRAVGEGNVAVVAPDSLLAQVASSLEGAGVEAGQATSGGLGSQVTLVPVRLVKGLELDSVVVVEPARIVAEEPQGMRSLYVALTRATRRLTVVHAEELPEPLGGAGAPAV
ncbi:MAG TPA: ATP-binding domain-containing protein [Acidimicrobiales bacterium]|nr:ATP-binding domain-containing protein [Acidimicrobiales bacterium]